jgi:hypothetical protein
MQVISFMWVPGALSLRVKRPGREADQPPPSSTEVRECVELHLYSLSTPSWRAGKYISKSDVGILY